MFPEYHVVLHVYDVHGVIRVIFLQVLQYFELNPSLIVVLLLVLDHLQGDVLLAFVVEAF